MSWSASKLAAVYIKIRDNREKLKSEYEEKDKELEEQMEVIEARLLEICKEQGADSLRTPAGTVMRRVATRYWTNDWDTMYNFIRENDAHGLLERRIHQGNFKQFMSEHEGDGLPPGVNVMREFAVTVRKPSANLSTSEI